MLAQPGSSSIVIATLLHRSTDLLGALHEIQAMQGGGEVGGEVRDLLDDCHSSVEAIAFENTHKKPAFCIQQDATSGQLLR